MFAVYKDNDPMNTTVSIKKGREKPILQRHPWIFSGSLEDKNLDIAPGTIVDVRDHQSTFMARGYYNQKSQIRVRLLTWNQEETINRDFWRRRLHESIQRRQELRQQGDSNALRLVHAEADLIPGLIVDQYADCLVIQALTAGIDTHLGEIISVLNELLQPHAIYERSDDQVRELEGLTRRSTLISGTLQDEGLVEIHEHGVRFLVDIPRGQKTGFYIDQRDNRRLAGRFAAGKRVLNCFAYTGGFGVVAMVKGAREVINIDDNQNSLELARKNMELNAASTVTDTHYITANVFHQLREYRDANESFDLIVLDPPKFARNAAQLQKACRGYKDLNLIAMKLLKKDGYLMTFSCSGLVSHDLFQKIVFGAAIDAGAEVQIIKSLGQSEDHPVHLCFPESDYLHGFLCRKIH